MENNYEKNDVESKDLTSFFFYLNLIYNDPIAYADLILNGNPEAYLKAVTEYKSLD